jgi:hypothetical protein
MSVLSRGCASTPISSRQRRRAAPDNSDGPPKKGRSLPKLSQTLESKRWTKLSMPYWYGDQRCALEIATGTAVWYHSGLPSAPIRWVLVRDPTGVRDTQAFLCTDLDAEPVEILGWFVHRWSIDENDRRRICIDVGVGDDFSNERADDQSHRLRSYSERRRPTPSRSPHVNGAPRPRVPWIENLSSVLWALGRRVLQWRSHASIPEEGRADTAGRSGCRTHSADTISRWTTPSVRSDLIVDRDRPDELGEVRRAELVIEKKPVTEPYPEHPEARRPRLPN